MNKRELKKHKPIGKGIGIIPGRVVWVHAENSVNWEDDSPYWWNLSHFNEKEVLQMIRTGIMSLTNQPTPEEAWDAIFKYRNLRFGNSEGYESGQKIAIKVNINGSGEWSDNPDEKSKMDYTNPVLIKALLKSLVEDAGVHSEDISFFDSARIFPNYIKELCHEEKLDKVHFIDRSNVKKDPDKYIKWSQNFSKTKNYLPTCLTEADYLINLASLKGHYFGVTLLAKNHFGTFINERPDRGPEAADLHRFLISGKMPEYSPLIDLIANKEIWDKTILYGYDALISTQTEGTNITKENSKWIMDPFCNDYTKSLFFSQDPLALDSVGVDLLSSEPNIVNKNYSIKNNNDYENYLHEGSSPSLSPSGTVYKNGNGEVIVNLGVHEHWNNAKEKKYSRNLGRSEGIELMYRSITGEKEN